VSHTSPDLVLDAEELRTPLRFPRRQPQHPHTLFLRNTRTALGGALQATDLGETY
jgi:hypothetical protein